MPAESERLRRRVTGRDRLFFGVAAAVLLATPAGVFLSGGSRHSPPPNCITRIEAGVMGGVTHTICGAP